MSEPNLVEQLKALGEPNRLAVAVRLADREWGAGELLARLNMSQPSLSRHLKVLREAGVIRERRTGRNVYYQLVDEELPRLVVSLADLAESRRVESGAASRPTAGRNMHDGESVSSSDEDDADDDTPKSQSIEDWLL